MASLTSIKEWHDETDILILGFGLAGASTAIEARDIDPDADILIVEKMDEANVGGNSRVAGQSLLMSEDVEALISYYEKMSYANPIPPEMLREWAVRMVALRPWIEARAKQAGSQFVLGTGFTDRAAVLEFPEYGAENAIAHTATILPIPSGVWLAFKKNVDQRNIRTLFEAPIVDLIQDPDTMEVFGAVVEHNGVKKAIKAKRGVVMATGGFENNLQMQRDYFGLAEAYALGTPGNTGDGVKILQKAGADMWHLRSQGQPGGIWPGFKVPEYDTVYLRQIFFQTFSWIEIAADHKRFYDETAELQLTHYKEKKHGHYVDTPHAASGPVHMIFDEFTRENNCLVIKFMGWNGVVRDHEWSEDNSAEIVSGLIFKADSIEELAEKMGRPVDEVVKTVNEYNHACESKQDSLHNRRPETLQPINQAPFYAIRVVPAIVCTGGGARRNIESEVLGHHEQPIPRLYEAGELGSMFSQLYQNGSYLTEAMISGRAAGKNTVKSEPWC
ncbi:FAD-dependent oxidoreductase [Thalassotalea piscium]